MHKLSCWIFAWGVLAGTLVGQASTPLNVVTTMPDLADVARRIGGDGVSVRSLTEGHEDLHMVRTRPSLLVALRRADVFIQLGLDAEHAWVPALLLAARNDPVAPGGAGFINASDGVTVIPSVAGRSRGEGADLHPMGNPHINLDPERMRQIARNIHRGLSRAAPDQAQGFSTNLAQFEEELDRALARWKSVLEPFRGAAFIEFHEAWGYFAERFELKIVGRLEPAPGLAPTPSHLQSLVESGRSRQAALVVSRPANHSVAKKVAAELGGMAVVLDLTSHASGPLAGYFAHMDHVVDTFAKGLRGP